jgi:DNA-binding IscR family transcriptional regulator
VVPWGIGHAGWVRFSLQVQYAICGVFDIAYNGEGAPVQIRVISERQGVPARYLEQIFQRLRRAGLVTSKRGPGGGYTLGEAPVHRPDFVWSGLSDRLASLLEETTIESLCTSAAGADVPRAESEAPMYFI